MNDSEIQKILKFKYKYSKIAQTFNIIPGFTDVWRDIDFYKEKKFKDKFFLNRKR